MSALPAVRQQSRVRQSSASQVIVRPQPRSVPRVKSKPRSKSKASTQSAVGAYALSFGVIACATFIVASLLGSVMLEAERQKSDRAYSRLTQLRSQEGAIERQVAAMVSFSTRKEWAAQHRFAESEPAPQSSQVKGRVAVLH